MSRFSKEEMLGIEVNTRFWDCSQHGSFVGHVTKIIKRTDTEIEFLADGWNGVNMCSDVRYYWRADMGHYGPRLYKEPEYMYIDCSNGDPVARPFKSCDCESYDQCFEPCGKLGHDEKYVKRVELKELDDED